MARPREFDIDDAVEKAMNVFWEKGYDGAGLVDLLQGMKISRGSFYKAFGSKKALFLKALERYDRTMVAPGIAFLNESAAGDGARRIQGIFDSSVEVVRQGDRRGCFMCNLAAGVAAEDPDIAAQVSTMLDRLTEAFRNALAESPKAARIPEQAGLAQARRLTAAYVGLRVLARSGQELDALGEASETALTA